MLHRINFDRIDIRNGLANIAQRSVHGVSQRLHRRRLKFSRNHQALAFVLKQIGGHSIDPLLLSFVELLRRCAATPTLAASARATESTSEGRSTSRLSALAPVVVGELSAT